MATGASIIVRHAASATVDVTTTASTLLTLTLTLHAEVFKMHIQNLDTAADIFLAPASGVTADDAATGGWVLGPREVMSFNWSKGDLELLFFIVAAGTARLRVWEEKFA